MKTDVTFHGAKLVADSLHKAISDHFDPVTILEALAMNLGLVQFEKPKARVMFDPLLHEDTIGGMLPGDKAIIIIPGWMHEGKVVRRATVKLPPEPRKYSSHEKYST